MTHMDWWHVVAILGANATLYAGIRADLREARTLARLAFEGQEKAHERINNMKRGR